MRKIPKTMATQHPDNAFMPGFAAGKETIEGDDEISEYPNDYNLGIHEKMHDYDGKEANPRVHERILSNEKFRQFFSRNIIGKDIFLTIRVPNPKIEKNEGIFLLEILESIPRIYSRLKEFYKDGASPLFEIILPMVTSSEEMELLHNYYGQYVHGKREKAISYNGNSKKIKDWVNSDFFPEKIEVIPLVEDVSDMADIDKIILPYLKNHKELEYLRVFIARSDPALNYGLAAAVLADKIALQRLHKTEKEFGIPIYPIIGVGGAPFRGNFRPGNIGNVLRGYPSAQTFTVQPSCKYDYHEHEVRQFIKKINEHKRSEPIPVDEEAAKKLIKKTSLAYRSELRLVMPYFEKLSKHVPRRRRRKLHTELFGFRIRAIPFVASLYSIGIPPEILGFSCLSKDDFKKLKQIYRSVEKDLQDALTYSNPGIIKKMLPKSLKWLKKNKIKFEIDNEHKKLTDEVYRNLDSEYVNIKQIIEHQAQRRRFLG